MPSTADRRARSRTRPRLARAFAASALLVSAAPAAAAEALVAVAANFAPALEGLRPTFRDRTGHSLRVAVGSSGKLYAQVANGAPFDVLLAADDERPRRLAAEGLGLAETRFTYATGRLVLWSAAPDRIGTDGAETLRVGAFRHLAIANPALAPYGRAARETLVALGLWEGLKDRIVQGEDVGQAFAMAASANAEIGLVALASVRGARGGPPGSRWEVPSALHAPIRQEAILLLPGKDNPAALAFLDFLKGDDARALIRRFGYDVD